MGLDALGEDAVQIDEPRVDEQRALAGNRLLDALEPEGVVEHDPDVRKRVAAARQPVEEVARPELAAVSFEEGRTLAEPTDLLDEQHRARRQRALRLELELDEDVRAFDVVAVTRAPFEPHRPPQRAGPHPGERDGEREADRDRIEDARAERPSGDIDDSREEQQQPASASHG